MRISTAPSQRSLAQEREWIQWFSSVGDSIGGRWGQERRNLNKINLDEPITELLNYRGKEVSFLFYWDGVEFSNSSIELESLPEKADPTVWPGVLSIWQGPNLIGGAEVEERTITIPNLGQLSGRVIIQGSVMIKTRNPRGDTNV